MKKIFVILIFLFLTPNLTFSSVIDSVFLKANTLYKEGNYQEALLLYDSLLNIGVVFGELLYNVGNASYKINKLGYSRYYYERALYFMPFDEDLITNLNFVLSNIPGDFGFGIPSVVERLQNFLKFSNWKFLFLFFSLLFLVLYVVKFWKYLKNKVTYDLVKSIFYVVLSFVCTFLFTVLNDESKNRYAIVAESVLTKNEPFESSVDLFTLHEGAKVISIQTDGEFVKIKLPDGKTGWVKGNSLLYM
ncbi:hypothetical protein [Thermaurantimonas aggregans]|uniref:hypothetical protein n=1 Tax=Thermaurantimonas aggregans TaxID=2173829 RepID=UPI0023F4B7BC|nr:hypothetical protein [Thermaurantimonas aggregans]MCX8148169.1 hypothetical protein [Thermaurantimonas aggregans]